MKELNSGVCGLWLFLLVSVPDLTQTEALLIYISYLLSANKILVTSELVLT